MTEYVDQIEKAVGFVWFYVMVGSTWLTAGKSIDTDSMFCLTLYRTSHMLAAMC